MFVEFNFLGSPGLPQWSALLVHLYDQQVPLCGQVLFWARHDSSPMDITSGTTLRHIRETLHRSMMTGSQSVAR